MSNGKVWRDGRHTVQRSHKKNWSKKGCPFNDTSCPGGSWCDQED